MALIDEKLTREFHEWERRGRGWDVFSQPISPEPPFRPFYRQYPTEQPTADDGRRPTLLSSLVQRLSRKLSTQSPSPPPIIKDETEPEPEILVRDPLVELQMSLPRDFEGSRQIFGQFVQSVFPCDQPVSLEIIGRQDHLTIQLVQSAADSSRIRKGMAAFFPEVSILESHEGLEQAWGESAESTAIVEFGLAREFMLPLASHKIDPYIGLAAALHELRPSELGLFQVIFEPTRSAWAGSIVRSLTHGDGRPFFVNEPELTKAGETKAKETLYAAVVRIATRAHEFDRAWTIARDLASALRVFAQPAGNELIPLRNDGYDLEVHEEDVVRRQSRRSGMILTLEELLGFVHVPSVEVPKLARELSKTKAAPKHLQDGLLLGHNLHGGKTAEVRISAEQRVRHMHIIGASGTGKTTLLYNLIRQDIENGEGVAVLDPHGDLVDRILGVIPAERIGDVVLLDPADEKYSIGFNILSAHSDLEKHLLASDLVSVFQRLSSSWGDQMGSVLQNSILALLESNKGGTLADLRRFLIEPAFRSDFLKTVHDPEVLYYWQKAFPQLTGNRSIGSVLTRLETFLAPKPIRYMVTQPVNRLDFADITDTGKIFLAKLSEGLLGKENSYLLGALLVSKFQQLAMSRQAQRAALRKDFWLYMDEFHNFITPSLSEILTGARKYRMGLVLAHHELRQLERDKEVASAVLANCYTRIVFRVGDDDSRKLADGFASFDARDLQNLPIGQAICRVERSDADFNLSVVLPEEVDENDATNRRQEVITISRETFATPRSEIERAQSQLAAIEPEREIVQKVTKEKVQIHKEESPKVYAPASPPPADPLPVEMLPPAILEQKISKNPPDLGRGGAQHQAIQLRIKEAAEKLGFRCVIEKPVLDGKGSVDLLLERDDQGIACEISISTTIDHEVRNALKCLKAGFQEVAVICIDETRLKRIEAAVIGSLGAALALKVKYYQPDQFIARLQELSRPVPKPAAAPQVRRGYKVKRSVPKLTPEEQKLREEAAIRSIAEAMRSKHT